MSKAASHASSISSRSGAIGLYSRAPPSHLANRILASATEVIEEASSATVRTRFDHCSFDNESPGMLLGILLTKRIDRTAWRDAIATSGMMTRSGTVA